MVVFMYNNIPRNALGSDIENKTWNTRYGLYLFYKYHTIDEFRSLRGSFREDRVESSCLHPGQDKYQKLLLRRPKRMGWAGTPPFTWLFWIYWKLSIWLCKLKSSNPWWGEYGSVVSVRGVWPVLTISTGVGRVAWPVDVLLAGLGSVRIVKNWPRENTATDKRDLFFLSSFSVILLAFC